MYKTLLCFNPCIIQSSTFDTGVLSFFPFIFQLAIAQKEMHKQMPNMVAVPVSKECRRLETALGRSIEKAIKANTDAPCAQFQEENAKSERLLQDHMQQITSLVLNFINKDLPAMLEKAPKKELASVVQGAVRTISPVIEKTVSSVIVESFKVRDLKIGCIFSEIDY